jgi:lipooligosaccharide transport system permease protein
VRKLGEARRLGRLERPALTGVLMRDIINFRAGWKSITFGATVQPIVYLLAFGFGFGSLVSTVGGYDYVDFVGTGTVATAVLFSSAFPAMFNTFVKYKFQRSYDSLLAAPVDTEELVTGEMLWIAVRAGVFGCAPMIIAIFFGLNPSWGMFLVPFIGFIAGFGWAGFGVSVSAKMKSIDSFSYIVSAVLTPLFLVAGTFFPIDGLPEWAQVAAQFNPLYHLVELVRHAVFGFDVGSDAVHLTVLVVYGLVTWRIAIRWLERRLIV